MNRAFRSRKISCRGPPLAQRDILLAQAERKMEVLTGLDAKTIPAPNHFATWRTDRRWKTRKAASSCSPLENGATNAHTWEFVNFLERWHKSLFFVEAGSDMASDHVARAGDRRGSIQRVVVAEPRRRAGGHREVAAAAPLATNDTVAQHGVAFTYQVDQFPPREVLDEIEQKVNVEELE